MHFRLTYKVNGYQLQYRDNIRVDVGGPQEFVVVLRHEQGDISTLGEVFLEVMGNFVPPRRSTDALRDLSEGLLPAGSDPGADLASEIQERRLPTSGRSLRFDELPNSLRQFTDTVIRDLSRTAVDVFRLIRWRRAMTGPVEALQARALEWCDDSGLWHTLPLDVQWKIGPAYILPSSTPDEIANLEAMASSGIHEPLGHALLREAQNASGRQEYASALVMGIAALEIGVKELIGTLIPGAEWLALHAPSPPIVEILRDYLPTIPAHESIGGNVVAPPAEILETVRNGVTRRNETVHRGQGELRLDFIARVLGAVADVLWMCDYFTGQKWALQNLSDQMRAALPIPKAVEPPDAAEAADAPPSTPDAAQAADAPPSTLDTATTTSTAE
jgi:hypothetical protein